MEQWKKIEKVPGYEVSDYGRVKNSKTGRILTPRVKDRRNVVTLGPQDARCMHCVSHLVAEAFLPEGKRAGKVKIWHINGNNTDDRAVNLSWNNPEIDVWYREYKEEGLSYYQIGERHHVSRYQVRKAFIRAGYEICNLKQACKDNGKRNHQEAVERFKSEFPDKEFIPQHKERREYVKRHRKHDRGITWQAIAQRDGLTCCICGKPIDPNATVSAEQPTIEHIVPIAKGGTHTWDNVRLAHRGCNSRKNDKMPETYITDSEVC